MEAPLDAALLDVLLPLYPQPDFEAQFETLTHNEPRSRSFLLKMELKRLWTTCIRVIDMRFQGYPCEEWSYQGVTHFLGHQDRQLFQLALKRYQNYYTLGVYEWFMQNRENTTPDKIAKAYQNARLRLPMLRMNQQAAGREERLHIVTEVNLYPGGHEPAVRARLSNLSERGLKLVLLEPCAYEIGGCCDIEFTELQKEFASGILQRRWRYLIRDEEHGAGGTHLRLLVEQAESPLTYFLSQFIEQNRSRYRMSIDFLFSATEAKGFEQIYLPRVTGLPLFFSGGPEPQLLFVLKTENNGSILNDWKNAKNEDSLAHLFPAERLQHWFQSAATQRDPSAPFEVLLYTFTHTQQQQLFFYSATPEELQNKDLTWQFFNTGSKRASWRVYRCQFQKLTHRPQQGLPHCPEALEDQYHQIEYVGLLQQMPHAYSETDFIPDVTTKQLNVNALNCFLHARFPAATTTITALRYPALRAEPRYLLRTPVILDLPQEEGHLTIDGWTRDCSAHGLQIELDTFFPGEPGQAIKLSFPILSKTFTQKKLTALWYEVVQFNKTRTILHLKRIQTIQPLTGQDFFQWLIDSQQQKLRQAREKQQYPQLVHQLRRLYVQSISCYALFIDRRYASQLGTLGASAPGSLDPLLCTDDPRQADCITMLKGDILKLAVIIPLLRSQRADLPITVELYIAHKTDRVSNDIRLATSFGSFSERQSFVEHARAHGQFYSIQLEVSRTGRPDMEFLAEELNYMTKYARHKAKQLEESLWRVIGVCDITDTTAVTEYRLFGHRLR